MKKIQKRTKLYITTLLFKWIIFFTVFILRNQPPNISNIQLLRHVGKDKKFIPLGYPPYIEINM